MQFLTVNTIAEWMCFLIAFICLRADKDPVWRRFPVYLFIVCFVETSGIYFRTVLHRSNVPVYLAYLPLECFFVSFFLYYLLRPYGARLWIFFSWLALFAILYLLESFSNGFTRYASKTVTVMSVVFILTSLYYFYLVLKDDSYIRLGAHAPFWWVSGVLMFYFGGTATYVFFEYLLHDPGARKIQYSLRYHIFKVLNVLLYTSWAYACICRYRQTK